MPLISEEYSKLNQQLHKENPNYGCNGKHYLQDVINIAKELNTQDILDYGCGKSSLAQNIPFIIKQYDPAVPKYSALPRAADLVVCTDVLEHIEPECLDDVLEHLRTLVKKMGLFTVATRPAKKTLPDGRNAHLIQQSGRWWLLKILEKFDLQYFKYHDKASIFLVNPQT